VRCFVMDTLNCLNPNSNVWSRRTALRNNAGAWYNHDLFWKMMQPAVEDNKPQSKVSHGTFQC
jgi:superoxide dismutase